MNDLDTLRPEVMEAAAKLDDFDSAFGTGGHWQIIRAELLRLADDCARLRAERAKAELAALKARIEGAIDMGWVVECFVGCRCGRIINPFTPPKWIGKRVRLVVEE